jgi:hypothetical protein
MASGAFSGRSNISLHIDVATQSTNIATNTSVVSINIYLYLDNTSFQPYDLNPTGSSWSASVNGQPYSGFYSYDFRSKPAGYVQTLHSTTQTIPHNADGSKTVSFSASSTAASPLGSASIGSTNLVLTNFDFTAGVPTSFTAAGVPGVPTSIAASWVASVSYKTPVTYYLSYRSSSDGGSTWGSWSAESNTTNLTYTFSGLTGGLTYQLRVRAYNGFDNYSAYAANQPTVFLTTGGKVWNGVNWALTATHTKRWNGSAWVTLGILKRFDGTNWVNLS